MNKNLQESFEHIFQDDSFSQLGNSAELLDMVFDVNFDNDFWKLVCHKKEISLGGSPVFGSGFAKPTPVPRNPPLILQDYSLEILIYSQYLKKNAVRHTRSIILQKTYEF